MSDPMRWFQHSSWDGVHVPPGARVICGSERIAVPMGVDVHTVGNVYVAPATALATRQR
jgi:hypothetical protein